MTLHPPKPTLFPYTTLFRSLSTSNTCTSTVTVTVNQPVCTLTTSASPSTITNGQSSTRSEEHTSELQSHSDIVCRLLLEKKKSPSVTTSYTATCTIPTSGDP